MFSIVFHRVNHHIANLKPHEAFDLAPIFIFIFTANSLSVCYCTSQFDCMAIICLQKSAIEALVLCYMGLSSAYHTFEIKQSPEDPLPFSRSGFEVLGHIACDLLE
jgi:hypothetical protein